MSLGRGSDGISSVARDLERERAFLREASHGNEVFVTHVTERLESGDMIYGDSWAWVGVRKLLTELTEEAADLGAWGV